MALELPVEGYPISEEAVHTWFVDRFRREPGAAELARILNAMAAREATPPVEDTGSEETGTVEAGAPAAPGRDRR